MSKKYTVVKDELDKKGGGIYCFLPFGNLDKHDKAVFKIGVATNFNNRTEQYHTYYPLGVYFVAFLEEPRIPIKTRGKNAITKKEQFIKVENFIMDYLTTHKAVRIHSTTRTINQNANKEGQTEWFYTDEHLIHDAFFEANEKFGGDKELFVLEGTDKTTGKKTSIKKQFKMDSQQNPHYTGQIVYKT